MAVLFSSIFVLAVPIMNAIDTGVGALGSFVENIMPEGAKALCHSSFPVAASSATTLFEVSAMIIFVPATVTRTGEA